MESKRQPIFARRWILYALIVVLAGVGFAIGYQKHVLWIGILLAALGALVAWFLWIMMRIAIFTILGALAGAIVLGLIRGNLWFVGGLVGAFLGFFAGVQLHRRARLTQKTSASQ